jgi:hypothetical protein
MSYYPIFSLNDDNGFEYSFDTELDTSRVPTFGLIVRISKNGVPFAERSWPEMVPMIGIIRSFASTFISSEKMQLRYQIDSDSPTADS